MQFILRYPVIKLHSILTKGHTDNTITVKPSLSPCYDHILRGSAHGGCGGRWVVSLVSMVWYQCSRKSGVTPTFLVSWKSKIILYSPFLAFTNGFCNLKSLKIHEAWQVVNLFDVIYCIVGLFDNLVTDKYDWLTFSEVFIVLSDRHLNLF